MTTQDYHAIIVLSRQILDNYFEKGECNLSTKNNLMQIVGERIKELRGKTSREKLEEDCDLPSNCIRQIENGPRKTLDIAVLCTLADYFNVDIDFLLGKQDTPQREIADVSSVTGLSYEAVELLKSWVNSDDRRQKWPEYLSQIIEDSESDRLFGNLSEIMGLAKLSAMAWDDDISMEQLKDNRVAAMWYLSHNLTNIVERLVAKQIDVTMQSEYRKGN